MGIELPEITLDLSEKVISQLIKQGGYNGSMPESDGDKIKFAENVLSQAYIAKESLIDVGESNPDVDRIIAVVEDSSVVEKQPSQKEKSLSDIGAVAVEIRAEVVQDEEFAEIAIEKENKPAKPKKKDLVDALSGVRDTLKKENLPEPSSIDYQPNPLPLDLTELDDTSIRKLHSQFNACHLRVAWIDGVEESYMRDCEIAAKSAFTAAFDSLDKLDEKGKAKPVTLLKEEAALNQKYKDLMAKAEYHRSRHKSFALLADIYDKACERLSREWTMRTDQYSQSGK